VKSDMERSKAAWLLASMRRWCSRWYDSDFRHVKDDRRFRGNKTVFMFDVFCDSLKVSHIDVGSWRLTLEKEMGLTS